MNADSFFLDPEPDSMPSLPTLRGGGQGLPSDQILGRIDQYDLVKKLGGGGFGVVYLARDTVSGVDVALKTLHPLLKHNAEEMDSLREKFALVARLTHQGIAKALVLHRCTSINLWDEESRRSLSLSPGDSVMVMDFARGVTLSRWRRQFPGGVVPPELALEVARQVASALDYAHSERIVHRDIKPGNIMVETLGGPSRLGGASGGWGEPSRRAAVATSGSAWTPRPTTGSAGTPRPTTGSAWTPRPTSASGSPGTARPTCGSAGTARHTMTLPVRRKLPHGPPPFPVSGPVIQFVTINAAERGGEPFLPVADRILDSARFYHERGRWFLRLFLIMPDHLHMLATFPDGRARETCGAWKGFLRRTAGIRFQSDSFEHRIRDASEYADKWTYIRENPVRKGLVATVDEWPHWIAFDPRIGEAGGASRLGGASRPGEPL